MAGPIRHFSDLEVYREAFRLGVSVFEISKSFPAEERYALTAQLRRAVRLVGANIAESWGKRRYASQYVSRLSDADTELQGAEHWLACAIKCGYLDKETYVRLRAEIAAIGQHLAAMMAKPDAFVSRRISRLARPTSGR